MGKHIFLSVLGFSILAIIAGTFLSSMMEDRVNLGFPWQIEHMPDGSIKVFQVHLGQTKLLDAEKQFGVPAELTLFAPENGPSVVEAYFNDLTIGGLKAKVVASFDLSDHQIEQIYNRGVRVSTLGSGTRKVTLHNDDIIFIKSTPIAGLTYLPSINLDDQLIEKRFGQPDEKVVDPVSGAVHWLYANKGVDVTLSDDAKEVLQYVIPENFSKLVAPLKTENN